MNLPNMVHIQVQNYNNKKKEICHHHSETTCNIGLVQPREAETKEHIETYKFTSDLRRNLNLNKEWDHMVLWTKITNKLR